MIGGLLEVRREVNTHKHLTLIFLLFHWKPVPSVCTNVICRMICVVALVACSACQWKQVRLHIGGR